MGRIMMFAKIDFIVQITSNTKKPLYHNDLVVFFKVIITYSGFRHSVSIASRRGTFMNLSQALSRVAWDPDRNLGAVTQVSGGLLRALNGFGPKDYERAGFRSRTYDGGGRAGHARDSGVSIPGYAFPPKT